MKNRAFATIKLVLIVATVLVAFFTPQAVIRTSQEQKDSAQAKTLAGKLPADFAQSERPICLGTNYSGQSVYFTSVKAATPRFSDSLNRISGIENFAIRFYPIGDTENYSYYKSDVVLSKIVNERSITNGYLVVLSPH